jgi:iron complex transport system substrate-binding protein
MSGGNGHASILSFTAPPKRVVSLVPSVTQSLFDLGMAGSLVGVTDFCQPPAEAAQRLARVGGTRTPKVEEIVALRPDLVIANQEENGRQEIEALQQAGVKVWLTFPRSIDDSLQLLWAMVEIFRMPQAAARIRTLEVTLGWAREAAQSSPPVRVFCPIWQGSSQPDDPWWMTFNAMTYAHDVIAAAGGLNIFAARERAYPLAADLGRAPAQPAEGRDTRYPCVSPGEVIAANPEVILLPDEPYAFGESDLLLFSRQLEATSAVGSGRVHPIDGRWITWHGTALAQSLAELPALLAIR